MRGPDLVTAPVSIDLTRAGPAPASRRPRWPLVTATAAGVTLLLVVAVLTRGRPPARPDAEAVPSAPAVLRAAAAAVEGSADPAPVHDQALLVTTRQYTLDVATTGAGSREVIGVDQLVQEWVPADPRGTWMQRIQDVGPGAQAPTTQAQGPCGDYYPDPGRDPCDRPGLWPEPTPAFIAALPREPRALLARLKADAAENATGPRRHRLWQEVLVAAAQALERGLLPAPVRAVVLRALALVPGLRVLENRTLEGRAGVAVGVEAEGVRVEIIVDPGSGAFLGRCHVLTAYRDGLPPGTVTDATSLRTAVVRAVGRL